MPRSSSYTYNPTTGQWTQSTSDSSSQGGSQSPPSSAPSSNGSSSNNSNLASSTGDSQSATGSTEQQYNEMEINTLVGRLSFIVTEETIKLKAGDTVTLNGLGKYLSGNYYVKEVTRQISSSGYAHSAVVIKTNFGDSLKSSSKTQTKGDSKPTPREETIIENTPKQEKKEKPTLTEADKKHIAASIWNGNYGWGNNPYRKRRLIECFGDNNGIQAIVNKGYKYISGISPAGYSYKDMKTKFKGE